MREPCPTCGLMACAHQHELPLVPLTPAANLIEFQTIAKFAAACRKQWPGAKIVLRPNSEFARERECAPAHPANLMQEKRGSDGTGDRTNDALPVAAYGDGWDDIDAAERVIQGDLIKCVDGHWTAKDGTPVPKRLIALATITMVQLWKNKTPVQTIVKRPGEPWPNLDDLNAEIPQEDWEVGLDGNLRPPWQRQFAIYFLEPETAARYTFANGTTGASMAVADLKEAIKWQRAIRGDAVLPLVELSNKPMKTKFGTKVRPHFQIVEWRNLDAGMTVHSMAAPRSRRRLPLMTAARTTTTSTTYHSTNKKDRRAPHG